MNILISGTGCTKHVIPLCEISIQLENYEIEVQDYEDVHECNVHHQAGGPAHEVIIPLIPDANGSRFGKCSCGIYKTKTIPCLHMIAVTKSSKIVGLTSINIMPSWFYTSMWKEQLAEGMGIRAGFDIQYLKENYQPNPKHRYCPKIAAAAKAGRKKNLVKCFTSPLEQGAKKMGKKRVKLSAMEEMELGEDMKMGVI